MAFLSQGFKNLQWYSMTKQYYTKPYFYVGGFAVTETKSKRVI